MVRTSLVALTALALSTGVHADCDTGTGAAASLEAGTVTRVEFDPPRVCIRGSGCIRVADKPGAGDILVEAAVAGADDAELYYCVNLSGGLRIQKAAAARPAE